MYKGFSIICFLLCCLTGYSQLKSKKPLSLMMTDLRKAKADTSRVYVLLQIANYYLERVPPSEHKIDSALSFIWAAGEITDTIDVPVLKHEVAHCLAKYYLNTGEVERGKSILLNIINHERDRGNLGEEIRWLIDLIDHISFGDSDGISTLECLERLVSLYDPVRNRKERIEAELRFGHYYHQHAKWDSAENRILKTLEFYKPTEPELLWSPYYILSEANRYKGDLNKALMYALESVKAAEKVEKVGIRDYIFGQLALVYHDLGHAESSIEWYARALDIRIEEHKKPYIIFRTAGFLIEQLISQQKVKEASTVLKRVINETSPESDFDSATLFQLKANYYNSVKRYDVAEAYYLKMIQSTGIVGKHPEIAVIAYQDIGKFYLLQRQYDKSKQYLTNALDVDFPASTPARIRDIHLMLYTVDSSIGNYMSAFKHIRQYQKLNDSLFKASKSRQIEELKIQYETEKIGQNNRLLEKETRLQQDKLTHANFTRNWILGGLGAMFVFVAFLLYHATVRQRTNRKLELQQQEISQKNVSLNHLINEKEWLIKEIHHRVKNNFHMVIGLLDTQSGYLKHDEALTAIKESQRRIQAMAFIHQKLYQSTNLSSVEMSAYIHELVDYLQYSFDTGQQVLFRLDIQQSSFNLSHALPLALILNEAITNSIKYGFPGRQTGTITISLRNVHADRFLLAIADNGRGIPSGFDFRNSDTMGIKLMQGLCEDIHGHLQIENRSGTRIKISFIYDPSAVNEIKLNTSTLTKETIL